MFIVEIGASFKRKIVTFVVRPCPCVDVFATIECYNRKVISGSRTTIFNTIVIIVGIS